MGSGKKAGNLNTLSLENLFLEGLDKATSEVPQLTLLPQIEPAKFQA
jgi:hypothetical protein